MSWGSTDDSTLAGSGFPTASYFGGEIPYNGPTIPDTDHRTSPEVIRDDGTRTGSVPTPPYTSPLTVPSAEFSYFDTSRRVSADSGADSYDDQQPVSPISPVSSIESIRRRSLGGSFGSQHQVSDIFIKTDSSPPAYITSPDASELAAADGLTSKSAATDPKSKPSAKNRGVAKRKPKGPSRKSSAAAAATTTTRDDASNEKNHKGRLRTACRGAKASTTSSSSPTKPAPVALAEQDDDLLTPDERRARLSHNRVEKQYRNRLNQQFESLLAVLPAEGDGRGGGGGGGQGLVKGAGVAAAGEDRRLSKAEVLERARRRILTLEEQSRRLVLERRELMEDVGIMRSVAGRGQEA